MSPELAALNLPRLFKTRNVPQGEPAHLQAVGQAPCSRLLRVPLSTSGSTNAANCFGINFAATVCVHVHIHSHSIICAHCAIRAVCAHYWHAHALGSAEVAKHEKRLLFASAYLVYWPRGYNIKLGIHARVVNGSLGCSSCDRTSLPKIEFSRQTRRSCLLGHCRPRPASFNHPFFHGRLLLPDRERESNCRLQPFEKRANLDNHPEHFVCVLLHFGSQVLAV